jgi:glycosyltransferase involved in cell wall biosynthesis
VTSDGPPRVLLLTNAIAPDKLGGLERYGRELSAELVRKGVTVTVITKRVGDGDPAIETGEDGVTIRRHAAPAKSNPLFPILYPIRIGCAVARELRRAPDAIVHAHYPITSIPAALARRSYLHTFHAPVHKEMLSERQSSYRLPAAVQGGAVKSLRAAERFVGLRAAATVTLSTFMEQEFRELVAPHPQAVSVIPGGIDTGWFSPGHREDLWPEASPLLFAARRLTLRTGVKELVSAMPMILSAHPGARLAIAGDGGERRPIEGEIARLGLQKHVRLLGQVSEVDLRAWYRAADLAVSPTQELEGFGLSTGEALACGTPALVTPVGANPELVRGLSGALVSPGRAPEGLAAGVTGLLADPLTLANLRAGARAQAHPAWSWSTVADAYLRIYEGLRA